MKNKWNRKDAKPEDTISRISKILNDLGMEYVVKFENECSLYWYSINIEIKQLPGLYANGKGISKEYALASALGELMERIQTGLLIDFSFFGNQKDIMTKEKNQNEKLEIHKILFYLMDIFSDYKIEEIMEFLNQYPEYSESENYENIIDNKKYKLPHNIIHYICGSN